MSLLYDTYKEMSRVQEEVVITDEGIYSKDGVPDSYGGATLNVMVAHTIHMVNAGGKMLTLEFHNEAPKNKDKSDKKRPVLIDGTPAKAPANGTTPPGETRDGEPRTWVTKESTSLYGRVKANGLVTKEMRDQTVLNYVDV